MTVSVIAAALLFALPDRSEESVATQPYRVTVWLDIESHPRFSPALRSWLVQRLHANTRRAIGNAWELTISNRPPALSAMQNPTTKELRELNLGADKLVWLRIHSSRDDVSGSFVRLLVSEYDFLFDDWSVPSIQEVRTLDRLADDLFDAVCGQFRPHAHVLGLNEDGKVEIQLKGLALQPSNSPSPLAPDGMPFRVFREYKEKDEVIALTEVPYTFLLYREASRDRSLARCDLVSALRSPLSRRTRRRARMLALGASRSAQVVTQVHFVTGEEKLPVVGLEVSLRPQDRRARVPIGTTDQHGGVVVTPVRLASEIGQDVPANRMFELQLSTGDAVVASFPLLPGETADLEVAVQVDPLLTEVSGLVIGLHDQLLDAVVARKVLSTQLEKLASENNVDEAQQIAEKLSQQPNLTFFEGKLKSIKQHVEQRSKELERPSLGGTISKLFVQTENLLKKFAPDLLDRKVQIATEVKPAPAKENAESKSPAEEKQ